MLHSHDLVELRFLFQDYVDHKHKMANAIKALGDVQHSLSNFYSPELPAQTQLITDLEERLKTSYKGKDAFKVQLTQYIDKKGYRRDSHFYLKCGITRQHFSKIVGWRKMIPQKKMVIVMALVLNLTIEEAEEFLSSANYHLSEYNKTDIVVRYCYEHGIYELEDVNEALEIFEEEPLI